MQVQPLSPSNVLFLESFITEEPMKQKPWEKLGLSEKAWLIRRVALASTVLEISDASPLEFCRDKQQLEDLASQLNRSQLRKDVLAVEARLNRLNPCK
jgi:hypothetical protein